MTYLGTRNISFFIDFRISSAVRDSSKLSLKETILDAMVETIITAEKDNDFKRKSTELWKKMDVLGLKFVTFRQKS